MMTLPNFLGLGGQRCGSTWLYDLLRSHPQIYIPYLKEIHFFKDKTNYRRGLKWYEKFFPDEATASRYRAIGEITPNYLDCSDCPERIAQIPSIIKFIVILRNPVDRVYSHYGLVVKDVKFSGTFEDFLVSSTASGSKMANLIERGRYNHGLQEYFRYFNREQFLVLIMEQAVADLSQAKQALGQFFEINVERFPAAAGTAKINPSFVPRFRPVSWLSIKLLFALRRLGIYHGLSLKFMIDRMMGEGKTNLPPMREETRERLKQLYAPDIEELSSMLQMDLTCWQ